MIYLKQIINFHKILLPVRSERNRARLARSDSYGRYSVRDRLAVHPRVDGWSTTSARRRNRALGQGHDDVDKLRQIFVSFSFRLPWYYALQVTFLTKNCGTSGILKPKHNNSSEWMRLRKYVINWNETRYKYMKPAMADSAQHWNKTIHEQTLKKKVYLKECVHCSEYRSHWYRGIINRNKWSQSNVSYSATR